MSKIEDLIAELCPDGVRNPTLSELIFLQRGERVTKNDLLPDGKVPVVSGGKGYMGFVDHSNREVNTITIAQYGAAGYVAWQKQAFWANDVCFSVVLTTELLQQRYLYHFLKSRQELLYGISNRVAVPYSIDAKRLLSITIPLPPIEVQREIVSILDRFTQLEVELEAELEARKSQYQHTREQLLGFSGDLSKHPMSKLIAEMCPEGVEYVPLGSCVLTNLGGGTPSRSVERYWRGDIPWASVGDLKTSRIAMGLPRQSISSEGLASSSSNVIPAGWVVVAVKIAPGTMRVVSTPVAINQDIRGLELAPTIHPNYLTYYFETISIASNGTIVQGVTNKMLEAVPVPIPPLTLQKEIVTILDKLDALVNDPKFGLPAEITARRKQYEYYRNKLLTFKELESA